MRVIGIDPSSSVCGVAVCDGEELLWTDIWKKTAHKSDAWNLYDYFRWLSAKLTESEAHMACVEFLRVDRNVQAVRMISHYQAVSALASKMSGMVVIEAHVKTARKEALGRGDYSKDQAWDIVKKRFSDHTFHAKNSGGTDEADAIVLALAGPGIAEK